MALAAIEAALTFPLSVSPAALWLGGASRPVHSTASGSMTWQVVGPLEPALRHRYHRASGQNRPNGSPDVKITRTVKKILDNYESDNPGTKGNLARILMHGRLGGSGKM